MIPLLTKTNGGYFAGELLHNGVEHAVIVSPKAVGELKDAAWAEDFENIAATSYTDGRKNTAVMAEAGSQLAKDILALEIEGFTDWALPARDQLELIYRAAKPSERENYCSFRDGENPSAVPPTYPYTPESPSQTKAQQFTLGGSEALEEAWYWSSTQYSSVYAWFQDFSYGNQCCNAKAYQARGRAVRMIPLSDLSI